MAGLRELKSQILVDEVIDDAEVEVIYRHVREDHRIDLEDLKFLVEVCCEARQTCAGFRRLLFESMKEHILEDGGVSLSEQFYLLKAMYADGTIDAEEKAFVRDLKAATKDVSPEFDTMCEELLAE